MINNEVSSTFTTSEEDSAPTERVPHTQSVPSLDDLFCFELGAYEKALPFMIQAVSDLEEEAGELLKERKYARVDRETMDQDQKEYLQAVAMRVQFWQQVSNYAHHLVNKCENQMFHMIQEQK
jgi:hypothetical protein